MPEPRIRALVLAAGRGERLRPLTDGVPKPLLPVGGQPVAGFSLAALERVGCEAAALNLHHLGEAIRARFGATWGRLPLAYSPEASLLGTLGALGPLREFFAAADVGLILNGDSLCRWPLDRLLRVHLATGADATLLFSRHAAPASFGGGVALARDGRVATFRRAPLPDPPELRRRVFAGVHAFRPEAVLPRVPDGVADLVRDLFEPLLAAGRALAAVETGRPWHDLGTARRYLAGVRSFLGSPRLARSGRWAAAAGLVRSWIAPDVERDPGARVASSVIEAGCRLGAGCRIERSLLLPGAQAAAGAWVRDSILGPGTLLAAGARVEGRLVTCAGAGDPPAGAARVGDLLFIPIDPAGRPGRLASPPADRPGSPDG